LNCCLLQQLEGRDPSVVDDEEDDDDLNNAEENRDEDMDEDEDEEENEDEDEDENEDEDGDDNVSILESSTNDDEDLDPELRRKLEEALRINGVGQSSVQEDEDSEELMDDEQMMAIDGQLAEIFKSRANASGKGLSLLSRIGFHVLNSHCQTL
jgi:DNA polymerase phi